MARAHKPERRQDAWNRASDWAWDRAFRALLWLALRLPYRTRIPAFGWLAAHVAGPIAGGPRRIAENLAYVWPDLPAPRRRAIARGAMDNAGRLLIENYSRADFPARAARARPRGPGLADYAATMEGLSGPVFAQTAQGMRGLLRYLRGGGTAMMLADLYVGGGTELPFLGRPAMTATSAAEIALKLGALLVPVYGIRQPDGLGFDIVVEAPIPASDPVTMTAAYNESVSARIEAHPEQWYWMHRRWKRRKARGDVPAATLSRGRWRR